MQPVSKKEILSIGLMLFALFFGAGNMIFPPALGQSAGSHFWPAIAGFILTGVGLPLMGVIAVILIGNLQETAGRAHPLFGLIFTIVIYLSIGPLFAIPRTGSVGYEMGVAPFLPESIQAGYVPLFLYTIVFFAVTLWLCLNPTKLVDRVGKVLTPILLIIICIFFIKGIVHPLASIGDPFEQYREAPFFKGFMEGYLTLDALAGLVFGIVAVTAVQEKGLSKPKEIKMAAIGAGLIAGVALTLVYLALAYLGVTSQPLGLMENGGQLLAAISYEFFGTIGIAILGTAVTVACLTTSVGLVSATSMYFSKIMPYVSYRQFVYLFTVISLGIANLGLTQIIAFSKPVLLAIYPLAIVIILLSMFEQIFKGYRGVYIGALVPTALLSVLASLQELNVSVSNLALIFQYLPLYEEGIGWLVPAIIGGVVGLIWSKIRTKNKVKSW